MSRSEKPFIAYRSGRWALSILPRTAAGWRALLVWMMTLAPVTGAFVWFASAEPKGPTLWLGVVAYLAVLAGWSVCMVRWVLARSEIVDLEDLQAVRRERDKARRRR